MNDSSPENQITYDCHYLMPEFSFQNSDTVSPIAAYTVTCLACPFTIVLNTLIIVVVAKNITLQSNTNILFSSMAAADLLVGVVVQPLTILSGAIFFRDHSESGIYCILDAITIVISTGTSMCSIFHLTAIAWQRHAIINLNLINNQATISRRRIKILASLSWMSAVISSIPSAMILNALNFKNATYLDTLVFLLVVICWILFAYYYISIYIKTRKIKIEPYRDYARLQLLDTRILFSKQGHCKSNSCICGYVSCVPFYSLPKHADYGGSCEKHNAKKQH